MEIIEYYPSVWTGKRMAQWFRHPSGERMHWESDQIQPNGIDLTVDKIFRQAGNPSLSNNPLYTDMGILWPIKPDDLTGLEKEGWYLEHSYYVVEWKEVIEIPPNAIGLLSPRSTLLRMGGTIAGAVWDKGYKGKGRSGLVVGDNGILIERGVRLAQMIFIDCVKGEKTYDGQYQKENIPQTKGK